MQFIDPQTGDFELRLTGYQFPANDYDYYDGNWVLVHIDVRTPERSWSRTDPCLLNWEAEMLAGWLADLAAGRECRPAIGFLEGNLTFELVSRERDRIGVRVLFDCECRPPGCGPEEYPVVFRVTPAALQQASVDLRRDVRLYPVRATAGGESDGIAPESPSPRDS